MSRFTRYDLAEAAWVAERIVALAILFGGLALLGQGCAQPPDWAVKANRGIALGIATIDAQTAGGYERAADEARERSSSWAEYDAAMSGWNTYESALRVGQRSTYALDAAFRAWGEGGSERWLGLGACLVVSLRELIAAARALELQVPEEIGAGLDLILAVVSPSLCSVEGEEQ